MSRPGASGRAWRSGAGGVPRAEQARGKAQLRGASSVWTPLGSLEALPDGTAGPVQNALPSATHQEARAAVGVHTSRRSRRTLGRAIVPPGSALFTAVPNLVHHLPRSLLGRSAVARKVYAETDLPAGPPLQAPFWGGMLRWHGLACRADTIYRSSSGVAACARDACLLQVLSLGHFNVRRGRIGA